jgi:alkylated DNA repair dioxygenase AlkB
MYERNVEVPRLYGVLPEDGPGHPIIQPVQRALSEYYGEQFERISLGYYRDGNDSVAWHGDYVARRMHSALVATVSVGAPRRFALRPHGGGTSIPFSLGWGDLIVMGGTCQRTWQHCIPKISYAEPRIAIMFRPHWEDPQSPRRY